MTLTEVEEILDYLGEHPTAAEILTAVYQVKPKYSRRLAKKAKATLDEIFSVSSGALGQPETLDPTFRQSIDLAKDIMKKMGKEPIN